MKNPSVNNKLRLALCLASLLSLGLTSPVKAETSWFDSFSQNLYQQMQPVLAPTPAPAVYPHPQTGQPVPWSPTPNPSFYGSTGIRG